MVVENIDLAFQVRNRYAKRWVGCETYVEFLKNQIGLERFAVRRYRSMQRLFFLASLAMGFLSFLQSRRKDIRQRINDKLRYWREPKSFWFYRLVIALRESLSNRARMSLSAWCRPPWDMHTLGGIYDTSRIRNIAVTVCAESMKKLSQAQDGAVFANRGEKF